MTRTGTSWFVITSWEVVSRHPSAASPAGLTSAVICGLFRLNSEAAGLSNPEYLNTGFHALFASGRVTPGEFSRAAPYLCIALDPAGSKFGLCQGADRL